MAQVGNKSQLYSREFSGVFFKWLLNLSHVATWLLILVGEEGGGLNDSSR